MKPPVILGQAIYTLGYPLARLAVYRSRRSYVVIFCQDEILLTVDWLSLHHEQRLVGGGAKRHESPRRAASREIFEEIGLNIDEKDLIKLPNTPFRSNKHFDYYVFSLYLAEKPSLKTKNMDILYANWYKQTDIDRLRLGEETKTALHALGWL